jgi:hypothetical protein
VTQASDLAITARVPVGDAEAVYVEAFAQEVPAAEVESAIATFSARLERDGGSPWQVADVEQGCQHGP